MSKTYKEFNESLKNINEQLGKAFSYLNLWEELQNLSSDKKNVSFINNNCLYLYKTTKESLRQTSILEIAKIFDKNSGDRIEKLINILKNQKRQFNKDNFKNINNKRVFIEDLVERYLEISNNNLDKYLNFLKENEELINNIKGYRDEYIAHNDLNKNDYNFKSNELHSLLNGIEKILNEISKKTDFSIVNRDNFKNKAKNELKNIINKIKN